MEEEIGVEASEPWEWMPLEVNGIEIYIAVSPFDLEELLMLLSARPGEIWYRREDSKLERTCKPS